MNCKQGDLAIVIKAANPMNLGKIIKCLKFVPKTTVMLGNGEITVKDCWEMESPLLSWQYESVILIPDDQLKPVSGIPDDFVVEHKELENV